MTLKLLNFFIAVTILSFCVSSCSVLKQSSKYNFNDGIYKTRRLYNDKVYVMRIDDDTLAVFPVKKYKDSTAILSEQRVSYATFQRKLKDNKFHRTFYKPSFDLDVMTIPVTYRPSIFGYPNQLTNNYSGALYGGYRIDAYHLNYKRTPLNVYKQNIKHIGYSGGFYAGIGNTLIDAFSLNDPTFYYQYEGVLLLTGIAGNIAVGNFSFGIAFGTDHLLDQNHKHWIYQDMPCVGFTLGLNIN